VCMHACIYKTRFLLCTHCMSHCKWEAYYRCMPYRENHVERLSWPEKILVAPGTTKVDGVPVSAPRFWAQRCAGLKMAVF
jgi:hypothetical protein